ncbi:hypothetical protein AGABI1DRAFT_92801 [Agaricus bisporus var. burnettii JB137-S8]|uniref:Velvet domain-containing protein n=1 Tax=Agaricus bisporus var. burnettii (strain JB137-S8 / ATCC MYA-4627 / FGSC 10392) TaxID=597362 RepID=K5XTY5_AGABU|nr:uncharacterized protein AGABI1DRAFT_92801 [Agaricus bisporus var. burnettii JB137-S8]EKM78520.1 hypothetical protein AGABI1DRAFT_92801 [Agaricus bisporus var. burnettii JB137-S8]
MFYHTQSPSSGQDHGLDNPQISNNASHNVNPILVNRRIYCTSGQFAGHFVRYELEEVQRASLGRKYARVDRRPLDPPPVVLVKIWRYCPETGNEEEYDYDDVLTHGLLCTVDLFRVPVPAKPSKDSPPYTAANSRTQKATQTGDGFVHFNPPGLTLTESSPPYHPHSYGSPDIVNRHDGMYYLLESSKNTTCLVGATFVQPVHVELSGQKSIVFVFSDLAVKSEGTFTLRYRIFDLFSPTSDPRVSQSPPSTAYHGSPSSHSISPTLSHAAPSPPLPTPAIVATTHSTRSCPIQIVSDPRPLQTHLHAQLHPHNHTQASQPPVTNPYPDPDQGYSAPHALPYQTRRRLTDPGEVHQDLQAQLAPPDSHPRVEPDDHSTTFNILAECWAKGSFRIYSTKEFPGLPASTELTKHLARWGVRLNIRETERRRRRRSVIDDEEEFFDIAVGETGEAARDQAMSQHKTMVAEPRPHARMKIASQSKSLSPRLSQEKRACAVTSTDQRQQWTSYEGCDTEDSGENPDEKGDTITFALDDNNLVRPMSLTGVESHPNSHPSSAMNRFNPSHTRSHQQTQSQCGRSAMQQSYNAHPNSNVRPPIPGLNGFGSQSASQEAFLRYARARKRDSNGSSSSGYSVGDSELHGMGYSY